MVYASCKESVIDNIEHKFGILFDKKVITRFLLLSCLNKTCLLYSWKLLNHLILQRTISFKRFIQHRRPIQRRHHHLLNQKHLRHVVHDV